jgi:hypothetical protein
MKSSTIRMLRAYLLVASLGAACIDACVVIAMLVFDLPERIFTSADFRIAMALSLLLLMFAARSLAAVAYRTASRHRERRARPEQRRIARRLPQPSACPAAYPHSPPAVGDRGGLRGTSRD